MTYKGDLDRNQGTIPEEYGTFSRPEGPAFEKLWSAGGWKRSRERGRKRGEKR